MFTWLSLLISILTVSCWFCSKWYKAIDRCDKDKIWISSVTYHAFHFCFFGPLLLRPNLLKTFIWNKVMTWVSSIIYRGNFFVMISKLLWEVIVRFVDIDGIVDHHCLNFLLIKNDVFFTLNFPISIFYRRK